jgi:hypothetical protein
MVLIGGKSYVDRISWDAYNESTDLQRQVQSFKVRTGSYPESVHADKIYRTRQNLRGCQKRNIRLSGPPPIEESECDLLRRLQRFDERIGQRSRASSEQQSADTVWNVS